MTIQAVLFDLGNTLVGYYHGSEFRPILRQCLERSTSVLGSRSVHESRPCSCIVRSRSVAIAS